MSEGLVEVSAMVNHVYQLENCEYIGLKEQLQELNVVLKKKSNIDPWLFNAKSMRVLEKWELSAKT